MKPGWKFENALSLLREEVAHSHLLPPAHANYHVVLADGLHFFLEHLPERRLQEIFQEQLAIPFAPTEQRVATLLRHLPALHKLGQVLARDHRLTPAFRSQLHALESLPPRLAGKTVHRLLDRALPSWRRLGIRPAPEPLAEGSVAVVLPFEGRDSRRGVLKFLKPGIRRALEEDLVSLAKLGTFLEEECARYRLPELDYHDTFEKIRNLLLNEVRLGQEQRNLRQAKAAFGGVPEVLIPRLYSFSTPKVTAMERIWGRKVVDRVELSGEGRRRLARTIANTLLGRPLFSSTSCSVFHADPHAGNLLATEDGCVGILDWSLTGHLSRESRAHLVKMILGAVNRDREQMRTAIDGIAQGSTAPLGEAVNETVDSSLRDLDRVLLPGACWLTLLLDNLVLRAKVRLEGNLLLFRKTMVTLEGVLSDLLGSEPAMRRVLDEAILESFAAQWLGEWPERLQSSIFSKGSGTQVSPADLLHVLASMPLVWTKWWTRIIAGGFSA